MGIFGKLFGSKPERGNNLETEVYMKRQNINRLLAGLLNSNNVLVVTFFASTKNELAELCSTEEAKNRIVLFTPTFSSSEINNITEFLWTAGNRVVLAERYPLQQREAEFLHKTGLGIAGHKVTAYCALDDALMMQFGGDRIATMMQKLGMSETESINHSMISSSLQKAQEKLFRKVTYEQQAKSPEDWFRLNLVEL
jgi:preprotein translocase subunit SecA